VKLHSTRTATAYFRYEEEDAWIAAALDVKGGLNNIELPPLQKTMMREHKTVLVAASSQVSLVTISVCTRRL
jgi:hypothetical protein